MNHDTDLSDPVTVSADDVSVEKRFTADEFPVPAIKFIIESTSSDAVDIRLTDEIPESFPMDCIGFHPDYENENWTAYKDHRVEFVRTLNPEETLTTVYGIRLDEADDEPVSFLGKPKLNLVSTEERDGTEAEEISDILGEDNNAVVREALSEGGEGVPGMEEPDAPDAPVADDTTDDVPPEATAETPAPRPMDTDTSSVVTKRSPDDPPLTLLGETDADEEVTPVSREDEGSAEATTEGEAAPTTDRSEAVDVASETTGTASATESVAAALATEIREGRVDDDDLTLLKRELDVGVPNSVDVRIHRLQSQMDDLEAYSDALATFLDEEGTGAQLINEFRTDVESLSASLSSLETALSAAESDRVDLRNEVDDVATTVRGVESAVADVESRVDTHGEDLSSLAGDVDALGDVPEELDALSESVERLETEVDDVRSDVAELDDGLAETHDELTSDVADLRSAIEDIRAEIEELQQFRNRLGSAFGPE